MNESHPLPVEFYLYSQWGSLEAVRERLVFTTHTPEEAGNPRSDSGLLDRMGFSNYLPLTDVQRITGIKEDEFKWALAALRLAGRANAVSKRHRQVCAPMWQNYTDLWPLVCITHAQHPLFWGDPLLDDAAAKNDAAALAARKKTAKQGLFDEVVKPGDLYDPNAFRLVWARRFAGYKRADLLLSDPARFERLLTTPCNSFGLANPIRLIMPVSARSTGWFMWPGSTLTARCWSATKSSSRNG
ncbi:hypothetical protein [Spirosoma flavum]|uniref:Uncharacterized protein n=1 Tax=Spirosoma flavum TaxID=2048557 RepID=A0ABW6AKL3_9BACT